MGYNADMPLPAPQTLQMLTSVPIFQGLSEAGLGEVCQVSRPSHFDRDEFLFMQGNPAEYLYVITQGRVKLIQVTADGQQIILRLAGQGSICGGVALFMDDLYPVSAQVVEDCQALRWSAATLAELVQRYPVIALNTTRWMSEHVKDMQTMFRQLATERVEQRLARTLIRLAQQMGVKTTKGVLIDYPLSRQDLAEMSGTTLYTVSRIISQWERNGLVEGGREQIIILRPHRLVNIAEDFPAEGNHASR